MGDWESFFLGVFLKQSLADKGKIPKLIEFLRIADEPAELSPDLQKDLAALLDNLTQKKRGRPKTREARWSLTGQRIAESYALMTFYAQAAKNGEDSIACKERLAREEGISQRDLEDIIVSHRTLINSIRSRLKSLYPSVEKIPQWVKNREVGISIDAIKTDPS